MSALDHLLSSHVPAGTLRNFALRSGITPEAVDSHYPTQSTRGWAAEVVQALSPTELTDFLRTNFVWGNRSLFDFPISEELDWDAVVSRLGNSIAARGNLTVSQAISGATEDPQVALVRLMTPNIFLLVLDQLEPEYIDQIAPGLEARMVPKWTVAALTRRPSSWRLEVHADFGRALEVSKVIATDLGLTFVIAEGDHQVALSIDQVDQFATELGASIQRRRVTTFQDVTGARKVTVEKSSNTSDVRQAPFYAGMGEIIDGADQDLLSIEYEGQDYTLQLSSKGSFWFRGHTPRELIDVVLGNAESILGL